MTQAYNRRVSELTAATSATEGDTLYLVKDGASRKISVRDLIDSAVLSTSAGVAAAIVAKSGWSFDDVPALQAASPPAGVDVIHLRSRDADDGFAHAMQRRLSASLATVTAADGSHWAPAGEPLYASHFGAGKGDMARDTKAFAAMLAEGRPIRLGPGTYKVDQESADWAVLPAVANIEGSGEDTIIEWHGAVAGVSLFRSDAATLNRCRFANLKFAGRHSIVGDPGGYFAAIDFAGLPGSRFVLENVHFEDGRIQDVRVRGGTGSTAPIHFTLIGGSYANGHPGSAGRAAIAVQIQDNVDFSVFGPHLRMDAAPASYGRASIIVQRSNPAVESQASGVAMGIVARNMGRATADYLDGVIGVYSGGDGVILANNIGKNVRGRGVTAKADQRRVMIVNNVVNGVIGGTSVIGVGLLQNLYVPPLNHDYLIAGNQVYASEGDGVFFDGADIAGAASNAFVARVALNLVHGFGNRGIYMRNVQEPSEICDNLVYGGTGSGAAISCTGIDGVIGIHRNNIDSCPAHGIEVGGGATTRVRASGNALRNVGNGAASMRAYTIGTTGNPVASYQITGGSIDGAPIAFYTFGSSEQSVIDGVAMSGITATWVKSGTDTATWWGENNIGADLAASQRILTLSGDAIAVFASWHKVSAESGVADDLTAINNLPFGRQVTLVPSSGHTITAKPSGTISLSANKVMSSVSHTITFRNCGGIMQLVSHAT